MISSPRVFLMSGFSGRITRRYLPYIAFVFFSYAFSWSLWRLAPHQSGTIPLRFGAVSLSVPLSALMMVLGDLGPGLAALILLTWSLRTREVRKLLSQLIPRSLKWTTFVLVAPAVVVLSCILCSGISVSDFLSFSSGEHWLRVFAVNLLFAPLWEEVGWRGYLLPNLERVSKPVTASLIVGIIWGLWHVPLYLRVRIPGSPAGAFLLCFLVFAIGMSILFTWIYNATKENLSAAVLFHGSLNPSIIVFLGPAIAKTGMRPFYALTFCTWVIAIGLIFLGGSDLSYKRFEESQT
jgi:uncharacterized protein